MGAPIAAQPFAALHAVWWVVLKPQAIAGPNGAPGFAIESAHESLVEATNHVARIPGGAIAMNCIVFVNPRKTVVLPPKGN